MEKCGSFMFINNMSKIRNINMVVIYLNLNGLLRKVCVGKVGENNYFKN